MPAVGAVHSIISGLPAVPLKLALSPQGPPVWTNLGNAWEKISELVGNRPIVVYRRSETVRKGAAADAPLGPMVGDAPEETF